MTIALDFYNNNRHKTWQLPKLPSTIESDYAAADWIINKSDIGWLELDLKIDLQSWKYESTYAEYVDHRGSDHPGWNSCCIHGIDVEKTGSWTNYGYDKEEDVPYIWTSLSHYTPVIKNFWETFPYEKYRRIRFMQLEAGGYISPHSDAPGNLPGEQNVNLLNFGVPINVAIIHPRNCHMTLNDYGVVPFQEGKIFMINVRKFHSFINLSNTPRIHMIAHGIPGKKLNSFVELISRSYKKQYERF